MQVRGRFEEPEGLALTEELLEALGEVRRVEPGHRVVVLAGARRPGRAEGARGGGSPSGCSLLRRGPFLGGALGGVAALALLALRRLLAPLARTGDPGHARE